jgi:hypothetical protein
MHRILCLGLFLLVLPALGAQEAKSKRTFPEAKSGPGKLQYVGPIPVATLSGKPEEIGQQYAELVLNPTKILVTEKLDRYMEKMGWAKSFPGMVKSAGLLRFSIYQDHNTEVKALAEHTKLERNLLYALNAVPDLGKPGGCSTIIVEPGRSETGNLLFGRNLDWPAYENLPDYTLVAVFKPQGKFAFATVTFPILSGSLSGMNQHGLSIAINQITASKDGSSGMDLSGTPMLFIFRKLLEECKDVEAAVTLIKKQKVITWFCVTIADAKTGCVLEVTPKNVIRRDGVSQVCCCTNHFRTDELSVAKKCDRYPKLEKYQQGETKYNLATVAKALDEVNQGSSTQHAMIFEPKTRHLHLSIGDAKESATKKPLTKIDLTKYFE